MSQESTDLWQRAQTTVASARQLIDGDPDSAAALAYYAAFYGVSALFAFEGRTFKKHTALQAAVHRELVRTGRWPPELGAAYSALLNTRAMGAYGGRLRI